MFRCCKRKNWIVWFRWDLNLQVRLWNINLPDPFQGKLFSFFAFPLYSEPSSLKDPARVWSENEAKVRGEVRRGDTALPLGARHSDADHNDVHIPPVNHASTEKKRLRAMMQTAFFQTAEIYRRSTEKINFKLHACFRSLVISTQTTITTNHNRYSNNQNKEANKTDKYAVSTNSFTSPLRPNLLCHV